MPEISEASFTERIHSDHDLVKHLGDWTEAGRFEVKARHGAAVLDLRSPGLPDDVEIHLDMDRAMVKLLVDDGTAVDHWNLRWTARGKIKDSRSSATGSMGAKTAGRRIHLSGSATNSEIRIHRGGIAILSAMFSRAYVQDVRHAHRTGGVPTIDDPTRGHQS
ncbi:hypothetical protein [Streptomyces sp. NBC_00576]|uniref:hypothetical protein n=1 Tax=Streptomyces sp. NBC_00576 TaxID=2903665 RepID=UPI002E81B8B4|nr:hypothetical protein [Streptomyces sp. NBC_00576]WUB71096.1 hypothetical protein OG734_13915 [Streptomyces sp. NBC_00576]